MAGTFLDHLEDLVLQTSGISERVNELIEVLEHQTPLIWGSSNEFGNSEISTDSPDFITAVEQVISNLLETSRRFVVVWSVLETIPFFADSRAHDSLNVAIHNSLEIIIRRITAEEQRKKNACLKLRCITPPIPSQWSAKHLTSMRQRKEILRLENRNRAITAANTKLLKKLAKQSDLDEDDQTKPDDAFVADDKPDALSMIPGNVLQEINDNSRKTGPAAHGRRWTTQTMNLMFLIYGTSSSAYTLLKKMMPLPTISSIYAIFGPEMKQQEKLLQNGTNLPIIAQNWREKMSLEETVVIDTVMGIDAASFAPTKLEVDGPYAKYCFLFLVMPIDPKLSSFTVHVLPHESGSLGKNGVDVYRAISAELLRQGIRVLTYATDGDRANISEQKKLFTLYRERLHEPIEAICADVLESREEPFWIADTLHVLKCQRTRLEKELYLSQYTPSVNATKLNESLHLNIALTNFQGISKMNDVLAVEVFSIDNLMILMTDGKFLEAYYVLPFACWYTAISVRGLTWETRLNLLRIAFIVLAEWYHQYLQLPSEFVRNQKFFVEIQDLPRYLNTIIFLFHLTAKEQPIAYNRIGTHPIENLFGLVRVNSHFNHTWPMFLTSIARAIIMDRILIANNMKHHMRREFGIAGVKIMGSSEDPTLSVVFPDDAVLAFTRIMKSKLGGGMLTPDEEAVYSYWVDIMHNLAQWKKDGNSIKVYYSGLAANQAILSRQIAFGREDSRHKPKRFIWTPKKRRMAFAFHINKSDEEISILMHCTIKDLEKLWRDPNLILKLL